MKTLIVSLLAVSLFAQSYQQAPQRQPDAGPKPSADVKSVPAIDVTLSAGGTSQTFTLTADQATKLEKDRVDTRTAVKGAIPGQVVIQPVASNAAEQLMLVIEAYFRHLATAYPSDALVAAQKAQADAQSIPQKQIESEGKLLRKPAK